MEYIFILSAAVLVGLVLNRKLSQTNRFWVKCYWIVLGICIVQNFVFAPYRIFRVLTDLGRLFQ